MNRWKHPRMIGIVLALMVGSLVSAWAQERKVPVTYSGDTEKTIARRAKLIEGAKKEGKIVWWGTLNPREKAELVSFFNAIYPFIEVDHWRGNSIETVTKLDGEYSAGVHTVDMVLGSDPINLPRWRKMGVLVPFTEMVPDLKRIDARLYSKHGDWLIPGNSVVVPQYNTRLVSPAEAPKSWEDMLDPKWRGHVGIPATSLKNWAGMALAEDGWGVERTEDYLRKLMGQKPRWAGGYSATHALLLAGEFKLQVQGYLYHAFLSQKRGAPVEWSRVNPVLLAGSSIIMINHAPHPNSTRLFIEWLFSPQGMTAWEKVTLKGAAYPGAGTQQSRALEGLKLIYQTEETDLKIAESGVIDRFAKILGISASE